MYRSPVTPGPGGYLSSNPLRHFATFAKGSLAVELCRGQPEIQHRMTLFAPIIRPCPGYELLVAVAANPQVEAALLSFLQTASSTENAALPPQESIDDLDTRHHVK